MNRRLILLLAMGIAGCARMVCADVVTDWNATFRHIAQDDGSNAVNLANPGWSTRAMAMTNGAIYDIFQAFNRTNKPFLADKTAVAGASLNAAVHQAAYEILSSTYPGASSILNADYHSRIDPIGAGNAKTDGMNLGHEIAQLYVTSRASDHAGDSVQYTPGTLPGQWRPDPFNPKPAWGPEWGGVTTFAIGPTAPYLAPAKLPPPPALNSQAYTDAYDQVKTLGVMNGSSRNSQQTEIGLFWGYDRATMGPPPVLFDRNLEDIGTQVGNSPAQNARMFAMASVAMADAAIAAWDAKFAYNYWRPVTAIHEAGNDGTMFDDGNPNTVGDGTWRPLGAPGGNAAIFTDDFTPPFPSWTSGHATMGSAMFKSLQLFFNTNSFAQAATNNGVNPGTGFYTLGSQEFAPDGTIGMSRLFNNFIQSGLPSDLIPGGENSPEGENSMSRIYLGVHWIFDQRDGMSLGRDIASFVFANDFQAVPEPATIGLALVALLIPTCMVRRRLA